MPIIETTRLNLLPDNARQFVRELLEKHADAHTQNNEGVRRLEGMTARLYQLDKLFMSGGQISEEQAQERKRLQQDHDAASRRLAARRESASVTGQLITSIDRWLPEPGFSVRMKPVDIFDVPLPKPKGDLETVRGEIAKLNAERVQVKRAPLSRQEIEAKVREKIATIAKAGKPHFRGLAGEAQFDVFYNATPNPLVFMAWLDPEALVKRLLADLPPAQEGAMSASGKRKTLADIDARKLELERLEEALVRATGAERRPDADVRAILSIEERPRQAAAA